MTLEEFKEHMGSARAPGHPGLVSGRPGIVPSLLSAQVSCQHLEQLWAPALTSPPPALCRLHCHRGPRAWMHPTQQPKAAPGVCVCPVGADSYLETPGRGGVCGAGWQWAAGLGGRASAQAGLCLPPPSLTGPTWTRSSPWSHSCWTQACPVSAARQSSS